MGKVAPYVAIEQRIFLLRGARVMLSTDLAGLYGVPAKQLVQAVRRNSERFPDDFCFDVDKQEFANLRSQFVTSSSGHGGHRHLPLAFTEQDQDIANVFQAIRELMEPPVPPTKPIGFHVRERRGRYGKS